MTDKTASELKAEKEAAARRALLNARPANSDLSEFLDEPETDSAPPPAPAEPVTSTPAAKKARKPASEPIPAAPVPQTSPAVPETDAPTPWSDANPKVTAHFTTRFPEELHLKLKWLTQNLPATSIQKLVKQGTEELANRLIEEHYKP